MLVAAVDDLRRPAGRWPAPRPSPASVMVITRRVRISSISVESNSAPALSRRHLGVVVEDDRRAEHDVGASPGGPASTGQQRCWRHPAGRLAASGGGSSSETNVARPRSLEQQVGADQRGADRLVLGRSCCARDLVLHRDGEPLRTRRRRRGCVRAAQCPAPSGPAGRPRRHGRPDRLDVLARLGDRDPGRAVDQVGDSARCASARRSTASSQLYQRSSPTTQLIDVDEPAARRLGVAASRTWSCRKRRKVRATVGLGGGAGAAAGTGSPSGRPRPTRGRRARRPEHAELPAHLVLARGRPVRVEQVALVEHGVGDGAGLRRGSSTRSSAARGSGRRQQGLDGLVPGGQAVPAW